MLNIDKLRQEYHLKSLEKCDLNPSPFMQFDKWFNEAQQANIPEANAMALATASPQKRPSCRIVLLKQMDERGFIFFTNIQSRKGRDLEANPYACATFYWHALERQTILDGGIEAISKEEAKTYFASRPRGSQLGSWASHQDQTVASRGELEQAYRYYEKLYAGQEIPMPPYWGGYRLIPDRFEFWQGRPNRLHDRFRYLLKNEQWLIDRLAP